MCCSIQMMTFFFFKKRVITKSVKEEFFPSPLPISLLPFLLPSIKQRALCLLSECLTTGLHCRPKEAFLNFYSIIWIYLFFSKANTWTSICLTAWETAQLCFLKQLPILCLTTNICKSFARTWGYWCALLLTMFKDVRKFHSIVSTFMFLVTSNVE